METTSLATPRMASTGLPVTRAWLAWAVVSVAWGMTYELIHLGDQWQPLTFTALRFTMAGVILLTVTSLPGRRVRVPSKSLAGLVVAGILMFVTGNGFVVWALQTSETPVVALSVAMIPIYTMALTPAQGGPAQRRAMWVGLMLGVAGVAMLVSISPPPDAALDPARSAGHFSSFTQPHCALEAALGLQIGCLSWARGSICASRVDAGVSPIAVAGTQMCAGGTVLLLLAACSGALWTDFPTGEVIAALATLTLVGSVLAYYCYAVAIRHLPLTTVALHAYISPVVAITVSGVVHHQFPGVRTVAGAVIVLAGVALAMRRPK
jgi:drug/metabolite transporter (DMT)-like permease